MLLSEHRRYHVVGEAHDGETALRLVAELLPDIAIIDLMLPGISGIEVTERIRNSWPDTGVVMITGNLNTASVNAALACGANAYVFKDDGSEELITALRCVTQGSPYVNPKIARSFQAPDDAAQNRKTNSGMNSLTAREREILRHLARGSSSVEIAETLAIAFNTVRTHRRNLMRKLGLRNLAEVAAYAFQQNIL